jgi:hypothetical protein
MQETTQNLDSLDIRLYRFASPHELASYVAQRGGYREKGGAGSGYWDRTWFGAASREEAIERYAKGDTRQAEKARDTFERVDATCKTPRRVWRPGAAGGILSVPSYLAGSQTPFLVRTRVAQSFAPVRIICSLSCDSSCLSPQLVNRGVALAALIAKLAATRLVTLDLIIAWQDPKAVLCLRVPTNPVNLSHIAACTSQYGTRYFAFGALRLLGQERGFDQHSSPLLGGGQEQIALLRKLLRLAPHDVVIPRMGYHDPIAKDPVKFVGKTLEAFQA